MTPDSFFEQPYSNRQLVLFMDDAAIVVSEKDFKAKGSYRDIAVNSAVSALGELASVTPLGVGIVALAEIIRSYWEAKNEGVENLELVAKSKVSLFQLPPGHPRNGLVYAGHPGIPTAYMPLADFHRLTFEHKFAEAVSLLMHLGAKTFKVEHVTGWGQRFHHICQ